MDFKVYGLAVSKNEEARYLESCLAWNSQFLDGIFVFDDLSTDNTFNIASKYAVVMKRNRDSPTFFEDESYFREAGWNAFENIFKPSSNDYVLAFDLDEFWYGPDIHELAAGLKGDSGLIRRPEMWNATQHRVDDLWKTIYNIRLFPYKSHGVFKRRVLAGGSHPTYAEENVLKVPGYLLHYGYSTPEDRKERFDRYISRPGHNTRHIRSILGSPPTVVDLGLEFGDPPKVWRGDGLHI